MRLMKKTFVVCCTFIVLLLTQFYTVNAHKLTCKSGSENLGWKVNCNSHSGTNVIYYSFAPGLDNKYKNYTYTAVGRWNNTSIVSFRFSGVSRNVVTSYGGPDSGTAAITRSWSNSNTGHKTRWEISYNRYVFGKSSNSKNNATATHEFGHAIGLADLKVSKNKNKLMFYSTAGTATSPTSADKTGAREAVK